MAKNRIDAINDAFIEIMQQEQSKGYVQYIKAINRELIDNVGNLTADKVKSIINNQSINIDNVALMFVIQNIVLQALHKPRQAKRNKAIAPIIAMMGIYSLRNPKRFVRNVLKAVNGNAGAKANELMFEFRRTNDRLLKKARTDSIKNLKQSIRKSKLSKNIIRDYKKGIKANKSIKTIKRELVAKYNNVSNIERALDTELHRQSEFIRQQHSIQLGYTHKKWKTQGDERVRETCFHNKVKNKRVPIDSDFRACGMRAKYPGDLRLPPNESIRCRCYLEYD